MPKTPDNSSQFIIYQSEDGETKLDVRFMDETVWLSQNLMAELFSSSKQNIGQHLKNIFSEQEIEEDSVVKDFFTTASDGKKYRTKHYNLDAIISVGYRVQSHTATRFRQWATQQLHEYIVKGFVLDDLCKTLETLDMLNVLRHGFKYYGEKLRVAYFSPSTQLNSDILVQYRNFCFRHRLITNSFTL